ncbi:MAG: T9SS type A sorting domain-containing protein, partial [Candidatus Paceibacterales bacterium]
AWSWTFTGGAPATSTVQNPLITFAAAGIHTVTLVSANGNGTSTPYVSTISVVNAPTIAPSSNSICFGQNGNIIAQTNGNYVTWFNNQVGLVIGVSPAVTTVYTYTSSLGACNTVGTATMNVVQFPQMPVVIQVGGNLTTTTVAQFYQWYLNGNPIPGETTATTTPVVPGLYSILCTNWTCDSYSADFTVVDTKMKELASLSEINIGPNPVKDNLFITLKNGNEEEFSYEIYNNLGQVVAKAKFKPDENKETKINVQTLAAGVYFLNLKKGNSSNSYKFVKQ